MPSSMKGGFLRDDTTGALIIQGTADRDNGQAGILAPSSIGWAGGGLGTGANTGWFARVVPSRRMSITQIAFAVSTAAGSDDAVDVGIYDSTLTRLVSSGAVLGKLNSVGVKTVPIATTVLEPGRVYYVAMSVGAQGSTAATVRGANFGDPTIPQLFGAGVGIAEAFTAVAMHPLPAGPIGTGVVSSLPAVLAARES